VFKKTIEALKAAEVAVKEELEALLVPYDPKTGTGGVYWHAAGSGILQSAQAGIGGLREDLEKRQAPIDAAQAEADAAAATAATDVDATQAALDHAAAEGIDISTIKGTGKDGKITKGDVEAAVAAKEGAPA